MNTPATIADVAAVSGVSRATVSLVLNDRPGPSEATRQKVRNAAGELGYRPDVRARRLRGAPSRCVALITTVPDAVSGEDSGFSFQLALAVPLSRMLMARGYSMLLLPPLGNAAGGDILDTIDVDAAVIIEPRRDEPVAGALRGRGIVTVSIGDVPAASVGGPNAVDAVVDRGASGADVALAHLVDRGARRIGVLLSAEDNSVSAGVRGYLGTLRGDPRFADVRVEVVDARADGGRQAGRAAALTLLDVSPETDAVYAPTDVFALGVLDAAVDRGLTVPGDLMVITNFNGPRAQGATPPLTSLDLDMAAIAGACVDLMMQKLEGTSDPVLRRTVPVPGLVRRASTGEVNAL